MYNSPDVCWDVLSDTISRYFLHIYHILGLNGVNKVWSSISHSLIASKAVWCIEPEPHMLIRAKGKYIVVMFHHHQLSECQQQLHHSCKGLNVTIHTTHGLFSFCSHTYFTSFPHLLHSDSYLSRLWLIIHTLTPLWLISPMLMTHRSHTYSTTPTLAPLWLIHPYLYFYYIYG